MEALIRVIKKWHEPEIMVKITEKDLSVTMDMDDFLKEFKRRLIIGLSDSLKNALPSVATTFRKSTFHTTLDKAIEVIANGGMIENISENIITVLIKEGEKTIK